MERRVEVWGAPAPLVPKGTPACPEAPHPLAPMAQRASKEKLAVPVLRARKVQHPQSPAQLGKAGVPVLRAAPVPKGIRARKAPQVQHPQSLAPPGKVQQAVPALKAYHPQSLAP